MTCDMEQHPVSKSVPSTDVVIQLGATSATVLASATSTTLCGYVLWHLLEHMHVPPDGTSRSMLLRLPSLIPTWVEVCRAELQFVDLSRCIQRVLSSGDFPARAL